MTRFWLQRAAQRGSACAILLALACSLLQAPDGLAAGPASGVAADRADVLVESDAESTRQVEATAQARPTVNARHYPSIQDAIDSLEETGGNVYLPAGEWRLQKKVRVRSNITLFGAGMDRTVLTWAPGAKVDHMMSNSTISKGNENIVVRDLTLRGNGGGSGDCCFGLRLINVFNVTVVGVAADNHRIDGFYLGYNRDNGVRNTRLSRCRATLNGRNGVSVTSGKGVVVDGCTVSRNNRLEEVSGIDFEPDEGLEVVDGKIVGNVATHQNVGISLVATELSRVANNAVCLNRVSDNKRGGIYDRKGVNNIYVGNRIERSGTNFLVTRGPWRQGPASACRLPPLPPATAPPPSIDRTPPAVRQIEVTRRTATGATIAWKTSELATAVVEFGPSTAYGRTMASGGARRTSHSATLTGLTPNTTYHYRIRARDARGNLTVTPDRTFTTDAAPAAVGSVRVTTTARSATITWTTDEPSQSIVHFGTAGALGKSSKATGLAKSHSRTLTGLRPNTEYRYRIRTRDAAGNVRDSRDFVFRTAATE